MGDLRLRNGCIKEGNQTVFLRGVAVPDLHEIVTNRDYKLKEVLEDIENKGFNTVRIPIHPGRYDMIDGYLEKFVDEAVEICGRLGLYCVLDWHGIGNPTTGQTRRGQEFFERDGRKYLWHDVDIELAYKAWKKISSRYGDEEGVIFEVFNEPAPGEKNIESMDIDPLLWEDWKEELEKIKAIIRQNSENLIIMSPVGWASDIEHVLEDPIEGENILYSLHPYPIHDGWKEKILGSEEIPLIVTEWGFREECDEKFMRGDSKEYGENILRTMENKEVHWLAWCYDDIWEPKIFEKYGPEEELTEWGEFLMTQVSEINS